MTRLFYFKNTQRTAIHAGTGKATTMERRLTYEDKNIVLDSEDEATGGVRVGGLRIKEFALFHGDPIPHLLHDTGLIDAIRSGLADRLPATYIDQGGNVVEGATGKVIFKA